MRFLALPQLQPVSCVTLGTNTRAFTPDAYERADELLDAFLEAGGNGIDTAPIYGFGNSERTLGRWLRERGRRSEIVLITKGCHPIVDPQHIFGKPWAPRVTPDAIETDLSESLERLNTDYIDLFLLHRDDETQLVGPLVQALNREQARGRTRAFGASNWRTERIAAANAYAAAHGLNGFVISSPQFGLVRPTHLPFPGTLSASQADVAWHARHQFPMLAWSVFGAGYIARAAGGGKVGGDQYDSAGNRERVRRLVEMARRKNATPFQVALAYAVNQDFPVSAIMGPTSVAHLREGLGGLDLTLDKRDRAELDNLLQN